MDATENLYQAENTGEVWMQSHTVWEAPQSLENPAGGLRRKKAQCWLEKALWIGVLSHEDPTQPSIGWELGLDQGTALYWTWVVVLVAQSCLTQQPHRP